MTEGPTPGPAPGRPLDCAPGRPVDMNAFLAAVVDGLEEDILLLDRDGRVVDVNRTMYARLGRSKGDIVGLHCSALEGGDFCRRPRGSCPYQETLATGRKAEAVHSQVGPDGRVQFVRVYTYPLNDESGRTTHVVEMRRDITARTFTEQRLQQAQKMAAIGELSTYIAHEIRNPLFAIGGFAQALLRRDDLAAEVREKVSIIMEESRRLDAILRSILNYARPSDARAGAAEAVDVNLVVAETVRLMSIGCEPEGIRLVTDLAPDLARAKGVAELLKQCLVNLLKNSMEAMDGRGGVISVRTAMSGAMVLVQVRDEGAGIPEEIRDKIFNPFFSTKDTGSGLGLAMIRKIVEEAGGSVELESKVGLGTVVTLLLPPALAVDHGPLDESVRPA